MTLVALTVGALIGLLLGALGGGGSILTVPALVYLLDQTPKAATTSSLIIVGSTALIALVPHARQGRVRFGQGALFGVLGTAGALVGSHLSAQVRPAALLTAFAGLLLLVAVLMLRRALTGGRLSSSPQQAVAPPVLSLRPLHCQCPRLLRVLVTATGVGLLTGFFGVGGGFAVVPALVLALDFTMPVAVGTSLLVIAINSATALSARLGTGVSLDWRLIGGFTLAAVLGSLFGGRVSARVQPRHLVVAFAVLLVVVSGYTASRSIPALA